MNFPESPDQKLTAFFNQFCDIAKVAIISHEDLLKFGNNQDMKVKIIIPKITSCLHVSF
jgi:hypothetical protein